MSKWVIVLFLLAALPGMTAVMAQGQEPAVKQMPVGSVTPATVADWGETLVNYSILESEPNNTKGTAKDVFLNDPGRVISGGLYNGDEDWYKFYVSTTSTGVLINTDAQMDGQNTDTVVELYDSSGSTVPMLTNDDMASGMYDSLLFTVLKVGWYYVRVFDHPAGGNCTANCAYEIIITRPLLISAAAAGLGTANVEGIPFRSEDVLALLFLANDFANQPQHKWFMFLDGSDVGITKAVVNLGLGWVHDDGKGSLSLAFGANQVWRDWQGINRTFKPWDWAQIGLAQVGTNSRLWTNELGYPTVEYHAGAEHGLTTAAEKPDGFDLQPEYGSNPAWKANVFLSTVGAASVPKSGGGILKTADEDLFLSKTWQGNTAGWQNTMAFDGSTVTGLAAEDIFAADYGPSRDRMFLVILGTGKIMNHPVTQKDIFWLDKIGNVWYWGGMYHLPDYGWNYNLDAIALGAN